jgi:hypothetical protein
MTPTDNIAGYKTGDLVVGSSDPSKSVYSATGAKNTQSGVSLYGNPEAIAEQGKAIVTSLIRNGGKRLVTHGQPKTSKKKGAKQKTSDSFQYSFSEYIPEETQTPQQEVEEIRLQTIQFENSFGKIKAKVEHVIEHSLAFLLIFSDEDSVVFEPKIGETLLLHTADRYTFSVYYPGVIFDSPSGHKRFMILFKVPEENQE